MPNFSKKRLNTILNLENTENKPTTKVTYEGRGPGRWDRWKTFMERRKNAFQHRQSIPHKNKPSKFILSHGMLNNQVLITQEIEFLTKLIKHYEVYQWNGEDKALTQPFVDFEDFWQSRNDIVPATIADVEVGLAKQNISSDNYQVIDAFNFKKILERYCELPKETKAEIEKDKEDSEIKIVSNLLNLIDYNLNDESIWNKIFSAIDKSVIKTIKINPIHEAEFLKLYHHFGEVTYEIMDPSPDWISNFFEWTKKLSDKLIKVSFASFTNVREFKFSKHPFKGIMFAGFVINNLEFEEPNDTLEEFIYFLGRENTKGIHFNLSNCRKLKSLELNLDPGETKIVFPESIYLEKLILENVTIENLDLSQYPNLKTLTIKNLATLKAIDLSKLTKLTKLEIHNCPELKELNLENLDSLENLEIRSVPCKLIPPARSVIKKFLSDREFEKEFFSSPHLHLNELAILKPSNLSNFKNLKDLSLIVPQNIKTLDLVKEEKLKVLAMVVDRTIEELKVPTTLEKLQICECEKLKKVNLARCKDLRSLVLENNVLLELDDVIKSNVLREVSLKKSNAKQVLTKIKNVPSLKFMEIIEDELDAIPNFCDLQVLELISCVTPELLDFKDSSIEIFTVDSSPLSKMVVKSANHMHRLCISGSNELVNLEIMDCPQLQELTIKNCNLLENITIHNLENLEELHLINCSNLTSLNIPKFTKLRKLTLDKLSDLNQIPFDQLINIEELKIIGCDLDGLDLSGSIKLKSFQFETKRIPNNFTLPKNDLEVLEISCTKKTDFSLQLKHFPNLKYCTTRGIDDISIENPIKLKKLDVNADKLTLNLVNCDQLIVIDVRASSAKIANLHQCTALRSATFGFNDENYGTISETLEKICQPILYGKNNERHAVQKEVTVSRLNLTTTPEQKIDGRTEIDNSETISKGLIALELISNEKISADHQRVNILNTVDFNTKGEILLHQSQSELTEVKIAKESAKEVLQEVYDFVQNNSEYAAGLIEGEFNPEVYNSIATHQAMNETDELVIFSDPADAIKTYYDKKLQQYFFKLNSNKTEKVKILYQYKKNLDYQTPSQLLPLKIEDKNTILPNELLTTLIKDLKLHIAGEEKETGKSDLSFLFNEELSLSEIIKRIEVYCKNFKNEKLIATPKNQTETILALIKERKGCCRHRSAAFVILCRLMGVPANMITNEQHAFVEVPYVNKNNRVEYHKSDLGGAPNNDKTADHLRKTAFSELNPTSHPHELKRILSRQKSQAIKNLKDPYTEIFTTLTQESEIKQVKDILAAKASPLIMMQNDQNAFSINKYILRQLKQANPQAGNDFLYIHNAAEFETFLYSAQLANGKRETIPGPLARLIREGGVITVNWMNFTATEIANYKSILDARPTLLGVPVSDKLKVIGLSSSDKKSCSAFLSRSQPFILASEFFNEVVEEKKEIKLPQTKVKAISSFFTKIKSEVKDFVHHQLSKPITIDLFKRLDWRDYILGRIHFESDAVNIIEGKLLEAIKQAEFEKTTLIISNPPNDDEFDALMHRVRDEGKLFYNGKMIDIPANLTIECDTKTAVNSLANVYLVAEEKAEFVPTEKNKLIYLGIHNIHECYERVSATKEMQAKIQPGFLKSYDPSTDFFYITDTIPQSDWQALLAHIKEHFPRKSFYFRFAPGGGIENVKENREIPDSTSPEKVSVIMSNDPDFVANELHQEHKFPIYHLTPQTTFSDLIGEQKISEQKYDASKINFEFIPKSILKKLLDGESVILTGDLSYSLYQQLLPLTSDNYPHVDINGERIYTKGKLILCTPKLDFKPINGYYGDIVFSDYRAHFTKEETLLVDKVEKFYELACKLPHVGIGRPTKPEMSYQRLRNMVTALKYGDLHPHNPIKGFFLYDYPKDSEDYAYLNVMGKTLFRPDDATPLRKEKFERIIREYHITTPQAARKNAWKILNCFSGKFLANFLGEGFETKPDFKKKCEKLAIYLADPENSDSLLLEVEEKEVDKRNYHVPKRMAQLADMLERNKITTLKGPAGSGKTFSARKVLQDLGCVTYEGVDSIQQWLTQDRSGLLKVLIIDEANMYEPGTWDVLKGITRNSITYNDKEYQFGDNLRIVFTGNPESYPGRYYQSIIQHYSETLLFKMPDDYYLEKKCLKKNLGNLNSHKINKIFLFALRLATKMNPLYSYSIRDLENLATRFVSQVRDSNSQSTVEIALKSCMAEFAGTFQHPEQRSLFFNKLSSEFQIESKDDVIKGHALEISLNEKPLFIHQDKSYLVDFINQDLDMRDLEIENPRGYFKRGILIEGDPGLGKSTLYEALLQERGFSEDAIDTQKKYYRISAGNQEHVYDMLTKAFHEGAVVILDELNLDKRVEFLLNKLLVDNVDESGNKPNKRGFMILSSQNPSYMEGRESLSPAMLNRLHMIYMNRHTTSALVDIAKHSGISNPELFVQAYEEAERAKPGITNMRVFYRALDAAKLLELNREPSGQMGLFSAAKMASSKADVAEAKVRI